MTLKMDNVQKKEKIAAAVLAVATCFIVEVKVKVV